MEDMFLIEEDNEKWKRLERIREVVIDTVAQNMHTYGITPSNGRLYGTMYFHDQPMTLDEMRDSLKMSKTSMSTGVRTLLEIKMVHKKWRKGERKDLYTVEGDWFKTFINLFTIKWRNGIEINEEEIKIAIGELEALKSGGQDPLLLETIERDLDKLHHALDYYDWLKRLVHSFESGEIFNFIPKKSSEKER